LLGLPRLRLLARRRIGLLPPDLIELLLRLARLLVSFQVLELFLLFDCFDFLFLARLGLLAHDFFKLIGGGAQRWRCQ
jgi:hypothetical protein